MFMLLLFFMLVFVFGLCSVKSIDLLFSGGDNSGKYKFKFRELECICLGLFCFIVYYLLLFI